MAENNKRHHILDILMNTLFYAIPFQGLRLALENYLMEDTLDFSYFLLLGLVGGIMATFYLVFLRPKTTKVKIISLIALLFAVVAINLLVR